MTLMEQDLVFLNDGQDKIDRWELKHGQGSHATNNWHLELAQAVLDDHPQSWNCDSKVRVGTIDTKGETGVELAHTPLKCRVLVRVQSDNA